MAEHRYVTALAAAIAAWLGFPIGAIFAAITLPWWGAWVISGLCIGTALWLHVWHHRRSR